MVLIVRSLIFYISISLVKPFRGVSEIKTDIQVKFGKRVRELRLARGYSQEELAFKVKLDRTYIGGIERGERNPALKNISKLADVLGVTLSELFTFH